MKNLEIIENENGKTAVLCSQLFKALGLETGNYSRWIDKNIVNNQFMFEGTDYLPLGIDSFTLRRKRRTFSPLKEGIAQSEVKTTHRNRKRNIDFVLSLDLAKHLAMMCRTKQGHAVRTYFIEFEKIHREKEAQIIEALKKRLGIYERMEQIRLIRIELNKEVRELKTALASTPKIINPSTNQLTFNFN
jgi:phage anti-repressor protein